MKKVNCKFCGKEFNTYNNKFCSKECYWKSDSRKTNSIEHTENSRLGLLKYYRSDKYKLERKKRNKKISDSHKVYYNEEEIQLLKHILEYKYVYNKRLLNSKVTNRVSYKALLNTFEKYPELNDLFNQTLKFIPYKIQQYSVEEWVKFKEDFNIMNITEFCEVYSLNEKTHKRLREFYNELSPRKYKRRVESSPEKEIKSLLKDLNLPYEEEVSIDKYSIDIVLFDKIAIEVQGDYWHANPKFYSENNLNSIQIKHIIRDKLKRDLILNKYDYFIEIWENEIKKNKEKIKKLLKIIKNGRFNRKFYSTSTWKE